MSPEEACESPESKARAARRGCALSKRRTDSLLAPFGVRSFRYQWPADLGTSCAFEMETIILGWYVLVETQSVLLLTVFAALQFMGTLLAPMFGVVADRIGTRNLLCAMRAVYTVLALTLLMFTFAGVLTPVHVFVITALMGLVRPSDLAMRHALVGETMPVHLLMAGMSVSRTTSDAARIAGAITGAGVVALLGMGAAYVVVSALYAGSLTLTLKVSNTRYRKTAEGAAETPRPSPWRELREGLAYVRATPQLLATMILAFLLNLTAFPLANGLLPYVAKEIYRTDQTGLGYMVAGVASGALLGSLTLSRYGSSVRAARVMIVSSLVWYGLMLIFAQLVHGPSGIFVLFLIGFAQSLSQVPMAAMLLRNSAEALRGRVMGIRMLAIYGLPIGLIVSGPLIARFGYPVTATLYSVIGASFALWIAVHWRDHLWRRDAPANRR